MIGASVVNYSYWLLACVPCNYRLSDLRYLRLRTFVFRLRSFLVFVACVLFILTAYSFSYARSCVRCVRLNGNQA